MPRIDAPTVREHREMVLERLVDVVEDMLRENPGEPLTAATVAERAGLARNSIYRYVGSVEELYGLVVAKYLPPWMEAVARAVAEADGPEARLLAWARENMRQAGVSGHGWLTSIGRLGRLEKGDTAALDGAHSGIADVLTPAWAELGSPTPELQGELTRALVDAGFARLDGGDPLEVVTGAVLRAISAMVAAERAGE